MKIFQKGYRGEASKGKDGSGIGLYLGYELAKKIGVIPWSEILEIRKEN